MLLECYVLEKQNACQKNQMYVPDRQQSEVTVGYLSIGF